MRNASLILLLALAACSHRVAAVQPYPTQTNQRYIITQSQPDKFVVYARNTDDLDDAIRALCPKEYLCIGPDHAGDVYTVERREK